MATNQEAIAQYGEGTVRPEDIHMPPPSFWPILLALGFSMIVAGLAVNLALVLVGLIIALTSAVGWCIEPV